jgi:ferredoxin--NADP+ reductase
LYKILNKKILADKVTEYTLNAPEVAKNAKPGQFVILRLDENSERLPFTICDADKTNGSIKIIVQELGYSTKDLFIKTKTGGGILDLVGPLGKPTDLSGYKNVALIGGGIGGAVIYPQAKALFSSGAPCDVVLGARQKDLILYRGEFESIAKNLYIATDDGSFGTKGFVTAVLSELITKNDYDCVFAVGPLNMMRAVCGVTKAHNIKTVVSMNSTMVDGTGMCGCCRVTVNGKTKYACVDGPEFDGHAVDFDEAINRSVMYRTQEKEHMCRLTGGASVC